MNQMLNGACFWILILFIVKTNQVVLQNSLKVTPLHFLDNEEAENNFEKINGLVNKYLHQNDLVWDKCGKEAYRKCAKSVKSKFKRFILHLRKISRTEKSPDKYTTVYPINLYEKCCLGKSAKFFLKMVDLVNTHNNNREAKLQYAYTTDTTDAKSKLVEHFSSKVGDVKKQIMNLAKQFDITNFSNERKRKFHFLTLGIDSSNKSVRMELSAARQKLKNMYNHAKPCPKDMECLEPGEIGPVNAFGETDDYDKLAAIWKAWRDATGPKMKSYYTKMVQLNNIGARENGYPDAGTYEWIKDMEVLDFPEKAVELLDQIMPLYQQIHAYVRYRLLQKYPGRFDADGPIPAHILGNVWAQQWMIIDLIKPFKDAPSVNVTSKLRKLHSQGKLTEKTMFEIADKFYQSIGLPPMTHTFWKRSSIKQEKGKLKSCHGSAVDFDNNYDFRINMCTQFSDDDFTTIHHEMGHIQYFMAYNAEQPNVFRQSANAGFHEALGDTIALSVKTPEHLNKIGFLDDIPKTEDFDINYLMKIALEKVAFVPFALTVDFWRWKVANGTISEEDYNKAWWNLRAKYQGLMPPVPRKKEDCDPMAKYHVPFNVFYIRYFVSFIVQFQFYESLCEKADHKGPLHRCDFYQKDVGTYLHKMMAMGRSKPWPKALHAMTGTDKLDTGSMLRYFDPLLKWLKQENEKNGVKIGWKISDMPVE